MPWSSGRATGRATAGGKVKKTEHPDRGSIRLVGSLVCSGSSAAALTSDDEQEPLLLTAVALASAVVSAALVTQIRLRGVSSSSAATVASLTTPSAPPPAGGVGNEYFDALVGRADHWHSYSLRSDAQLQLYSAGHPPSFPYSFTYDAAQDAGQVVVPTVPAGQIVPAGVNSIGNFIKIPVGTSAGHAYLITWDAKFAPSFAFTQTGVSYFKTFQFTARRSPTTQDTIWLETCNQFDAFPTEAGAARARYYPTSYTPFNFPAPYDGTDVRYKDGLTSLYGPYTNFQVPIHLNTWTRYWWLIEHNANAYERASFWVADETHDAVLVLDRIQVEAPNGIEHFWLEFNTSTEGLFDRATGKRIPKGGIATSTVRDPMVAYVRNVVLLLDPGPVSALLQRPGS